MRNLTLLIPGLFGPDSNYTEDHTPGLDALQTLLARSTHDTDISPSLYRALCGLTDIALDPGQDVPVAALTRLTDDNEPPKGTWMRADPVHLRPERDGLVLMDSLTLGLSRHDALAIAAEVNKVLSHHGMMLEVPSEDRWYIHLDEVPDLTTTELPMVAGRDIRRLLPQGIDARKFHTLLNEIQMQLYACDLNQLRERRGELPVNSIWFWGLGRLPDDFGWDWSVVFADDLFVRGLATMTGSPCHPVPADLSTLMDSCADDENALVMLQACQAPARYHNLMLWSQALEGLEQDWFRPALEQVQRRNISRLTILTEGQCFTAGWLGLKRFWRRSAPIVNYRRT
jgi:hypothetical protein